ncbi:inner membrane protein YhaH [Variibacter gotjawalensis]|uniref:Inner membrane protein YhaH n=1 Tax=Variibacter gotjawalensis TaxID=1333996 RepID=A0A0S3PPY5_9BRAD|nr:DUF805 domain-containing protein [Variibacter gotjawalensis]NIK48276.1 uncharacterized membrane protein YhaH (DUF805 family) [Variibacter gotjawalensis]RZS50148.1 uncharacterized membrane protein YhaH (DUF805 family) [Variibacter gotjawalensis]BAT57978.1 inner membrane protein YhaH [Variibacter gotjawalensis]
MDFAYLFTRSDGRINRKPFWMGILVMIAISIVVIGLLAFTVGMVGRGAKIVVFIVQLLFLYPSYNLMVKRLHDRDRPDFFAIIMLAPALVNGLFDVLGITGNPLNMGPLDYLLGIVQLGIGIWSLVELGCLRGTVGPNQHGPDPLQGQP